MFLMISYFTNIKQLSCCMYKMRFEINFILQTEKKYKLLHGTYWKE